MLYRCKEDFNTVFNGVGTRIKKDSEYTEQSEVFINNKDKFEKINKELLIEEPKTELEVVIEDVVKEPKKSINTKKVTKRLTKEK